MLRAFITGLHGTGLTPDERDFLREMRPCGIILFARNCDHPDQLSRLIAEARRAIDDERALVLIDQEGGRVQRLRPPHWRALPPARAFGRLYEADRDHGLEAAGAVARLMGQELRAQGITVDCAPVLDVPVAGAHDIVGDRAFGADADAVIALGRAVGEGLLEGGVLPVIKHMPGHGRARADSHEALPEIVTSAATLRATDFRPFRELRHLPLAMTAHVLLTAFDTERPATLSPAIMDQVIRDEIGYEGLVMTDDLSMKALSGSLDGLAEAAFAAGVDVALHCSGNLAEMTAVAGVTPELSGPAAARFAAAIAHLGEPGPFDQEHAEALLAEAMALS